MLLHFGITPYMVFDGDFLPSKAATEDSRARQRGEKKQVAMELLRTGKKSDAVKEFQKCVDVTPEMASTLIQELKRLNVPYVVAPYEADAQLVYLEQKGLIHGIISDDSDLLVYGAKTLLAKLDMFGNCIAINRKDFCRCREVSLTGWSDTDFRRMAIFSGCDYLDSLRGMGLKTAHRALRQSKTPERVVRMHQLNGNMVSENYLTQFYQAELTFLHHWVFCPIKQELVHLTDLDGTRTAEEMPFIGARVEPEMARAIANGDVHPITKAPIVIAPLTPSKRRFSQSSAAKPKVFSKPATIPLADSLRPRVAEFMAKPPSNPITSYFKSNERVPMGEMDPNCFEVNPQRVAQMTGHGLVPRVFPLPRPYLPNASPTRTRTSPRVLRRRTEPITNVLAGMTTSTRIESSHTLATAAVSEPPTRPQKKARLCDVNEPELSTLTGSPMKSRFFSASTSRESPRKAESEAYLLSDDSLEEALRELPDFEGWKPAKTKKTISIFEEDSQETVVATSVDSGSQSMAKTNETPMSFEASMPHPQSKASLPKPSATPRPTLARFSCSSSKSATPASTVSRAPSSVFSSASTPSTAPSTAASRMTPLQRLGALAMNKPMSPKLPKPRNSLDKFLPGVPVNPAFVPLPKVDLVEFEALNRSHGSEDQIVPDSDEEDDEEIDAAPRKLDLSRFAFTTS